MEQLSRLRIVSLRALALVSALWTLAFAIACLIFPLAHVGAGLGLSLALTALAAGLAWRSRYDSVAAVLIAVAPALQPGVLVYLLDGHPWQMEGHMYFFAGLAAVSLACDWRPVLAATLLIAAHHLLLSWLAPAALFMGNHGHLDRVLIHAVAVLIVCALLIRTMGHLVRSFVEQEKTMAERDEAAGLAERERERCDALQAQSERDRRAAMTAAANGLEHSVGAIAAAVAAAAEQLERSAANMQDFARSTGGDAREVAAIASDTSGDVASVAERISDLASAIMTAAVTAERQAQLSSRAQDRSRDGESVIRSLAQRTSEMNELVESIKRVSFQTDMLALNAAVEAGRAGEAGQGFAVVANEVKNLSTTSRGATDRINALIGSVGEQALEADQALGEAARALGEVADTAAQVGETMRAQRDGVGAIEQGASSSAERVKAIARRFEAVAEASAAAIGMADEISDSASQLARIAQQLQSETEMRLNELRAA